MGSRDNKLIFFALLFVLNIHCDVIHNVVGKRVCIWQISQSDSFANDWLWSMQQRVDILNNILI